MTNISNDRRTIRTKKMIRNALSQLIEEKGFNDISITDLTTRADINRGTFYLHYSDKFDLLEKVENEVLEELNEHTKSIDSIDILNVESLDKPIPFVVKIFEYFKENAMFIKAILGPKGHPTFQIKIKKFIETNLFEKKVVNTLKKEEMQIPEEYLISYVLSAHLGVMQHWIESGMEKSPEEIALILSKLFLLGPYKVSLLKR
ncbi:TetR/AcrR family transcriptional regulator [Clostridium sp.]|uniref:TetR/AcrR family transcriptional regulator n=1 Tax=Clostridium sp. TaxID=1506 RepID=UPI002FC80985